MEKTVTLTFDIFTDGEELTHEEIKARLLELAEEVDDLTRLIKLK